MITAMHALIYSDDADATRTFLRDVLGLPSGDAGGGWLVFDAGKVELGVHPTAGKDHAGDDWSAPRHHELSLMCDDIEATVAALTAKGATFTGEPQDRGFGIGVEVEVPGADPILLYQPRYTPIV